VPLLTFSIVRNPFSWVVSWFFYTLHSKCPLSPPRRETGRACEFATQCPGTKNASIDGCAAAFQEWLRRLDVDAGSDDGPSSHPVDMGHIMRLPLGNVSGSATKIFKPTGQRAFLTDLLDEHLIVEHIIRLEDASAYTAWSSSEGLLRQLCDNNPVPSLGATAWDAANSHYNPSLHGTPSIYYSSTTCEIVTRRFKRDFEEFGYDPSQCPLVHTLSRRSPPLTH